MVETCELALREAARIINVMREHRVASAGTDAVLTWSDATASRGVFSPSPVVGLELLRALRLVTDSPGGQITADPPVVQQFTPSPEIERFPDDLVPVVFHSLFRVPELRAEVIRVLDYCALTCAGGKVEWKAVPDRARQHPAWLWFQRIGVAAQTDGGLLLDKVILPYIADTPRPRIPLSQEDLDTRLGLQRERSELAEKFILQLEKDRLIALGKDVLADGIYRISVDDVCAGFDIQSFEASGKPRLIEVKSSAGPRERFYLSDNEREMAERNGGSYWLAWVGFAVHLPTGPVEVCWVKDLALALQAHPSPWRISSSCTVIDVLENDSALHAMP